MKYSNAAAVSKAATRLARYIERAKFASSRGASKRKVKRFANVCAAMARAFRADGRSTPANDRGVKYADSYKARQVRKTLRICPSYDR